jgi:hypothetical protein
MLKETIFHMASLARPSPFLVAFITDEAQGSIVATIIHFKSS